MKAPLWSYPWILAWRKTIFARLNIFIGDKLSPAHVILANKLQVMEGTDRQFGVVPKIGIHLIAQASSMPMKRAS